jgi:tRNA 2-thiouridine synthesizing protein A
VSDEVAVAKELDVRGFNCPIPIIKTKAAFANLDSGDVLKVVASNDEYIRELHAFSKQMGHQILEEQINEQPLIFYVRKT